MGEPAVAPPALDNHLDLEEIEAQLTGTSPADTLSLHYQLARNSLVQAFTDLTLIQNFYESKLETNDLPILPRHISRRVNPALRAGDDALQLLHDVHSTIHSGPAIANLMYGARFVLLLFIRRHIPTTVPDNLGRFEPWSRNKKRPFTKPSRMGHGPWRNYNRQ